MDMKSFPEGSPLRKKIKKQMSDLIQAAKESAERGEMEMPKGF